MILTSLLHLHKKTICVALSALMLGSCGLFQPDYESCIDANDNDSGYNSYEYKISAAESAPVNIPYMDNQKITTKGSVFLGCKRQSVRVFLCTEKNCNPPKSQNKDEEILVIKQGTVGYVPSQKIKIEEGTYNIITNISGYWNVKEKDGKKRCMLSTGDETDCRATDGRGLFFRIGDSKQETEITTIYSPGEQTGSISKGTVSDKASGALAFQYRHAFDLDTGKQALANPGSDNFQYGGNGYLVHFTVCDKASLKKDGECMTMKRIKKGDNEFNQAYFNEFEEGGSCNQDGDYSNNYGYYTVKVQGVIPAPISKFFSGIVSASMEYIYGSEKKEGILPIIFTALVTDTVIVQAASAAIMLSIIFIGYGYMGGFTKFNWSETATTFFQYVLLLSVINPNGWEVINLIFGNLFQHGIIGILTIITDSFREVFLNIEIPTTKITQNADKVIGYSEVVTKKIEPLRESWQNVFSIYDMLLNILFRGEIHKKLFGLLITFPLGTVMTLLIYLCSIMLVISMFRILLSVLYSILYSALCILLTPLIFMFFIFKKTKRSYESIISFTILFFLMPIITITSTVAIAYITYAVFFTMMSYTACYGCAAYLKFPDPLGVICLIKAYYPWGSGVQKPLFERINNFPFKFYHAGLFFFCTYFFKVILDYSERLAHEMANASHYFRPPERIDATQANIVGSALKGSRAIIQGLDTFGSRAVRGRKAPPKSAGAPQPKVKRQPSPPPPHIRKQRIDDQIGEAKLGEGEK